jgi:hypothetical protein
MSRRSVIHAVVAAGAYVLLTGCMPKMTVEEMKKQIPARPVELDRLDAFVGKWTYTGEARTPMLDEPLQTSGTGETRWDGDKWFTVSHDVMTMEPLGEMKSLSTWTYDVKSKKYRSTWVDSMGMTGMGVGTYDEDSKTWKMKATAHGPHGKTTMKGWVKFEDPDTANWYWAEYMGLMKTMEMTGSSKRIN